MTPRKFVGQLRVHEYVSKVSSESAASKQASQPGFLDQIAGW